MVAELKPFWNKFFSFNWKFGLFLILIVCIPRFIMVLNANVTGSYSSIALIMIVSFLSGILFSIILYYIGDLLYGNTSNNWYNYIGRSYNIQAELNNHDRNIYFWIFSFTGMIFSPIGEELFFRGIVHSSFAKSYGEFKASIIDSFAFAITHVSHFGLVFLFVMSMKCNQRWCVKRNL